MVLNRVLLITYYFPPSGGSGVQRGLKFAKYLPAHGWRPTVLTVDPKDAAYPNLDPTFERDIPPETPVERTRSWDPYALYAYLIGRPKSQAVEINFSGAGEEDWKKRLSRWLRANLFIPDARVGWVPFAWRRARQLLAEAPHQAVVTTGPPHSTHLVGWLLKQQTGLPWVADFRDPWTGIHYYERFPFTPWARALDAALERTVLRRADRVVAVGPTMIDMLSARVPDVGREHFVQILNGFDPADFAGDVQPPEDTFIIGYVGTLSAPQNPEALWQALARMEAPDKLPDLRVRLIGNIDRAVSEAVARYGLESVVDVRPYVPHDEAVHAMRASTVLLASINRVEQARNIIIGKLYEYFASGRPILGIGPVDSDMAHLIEQAGAGAMLDYDDVDGVATFIRRHYDPWAAGIPHAGAAADRLAPYNRYEQAGQLAAVLRALAEDGRRR